jgi:AcrR family transcriptional regulator
LDAAERLFAERGIVAVTHRQITEAAGQANNAAVVYHFGTKEDLVRAIEQRHAGPIEALRRATLDAGEPSTLREWVACFVEPVSEHLTALGNPTWYARFAAQVMAAPTYQRIVTKNALESPTIRRVMDGIARSVPELPDCVRVERTIMTRILLVHTIAEFERGLAEQKQIGRRDWRDASKGLVDGVVGLWQAPVSPP